MATNITISTGGTTTVVTVPEKQNIISVFQNQFATAEQNKLAGIEAGATTDQVLTGGANVTVVESSGDYTINLDDSVSLIGTLSVTGGIAGNVTGDLNGNVTGNVTGDLTGNVTGNVTGDVAGNLTGDVTGDVTGNVTGNVIGNLEGDVTGNVSGNAGTVTNGLYTTSGIGDLADVSTSGIGDDNVLVSDGSGNFTPKSTFEAFLSSAAQYNTDVSGPLPGNGGDINGDGIVTTADLLAFLTSFGTNVNLDGYVKALFTTDGSFVDLQENNTLTTGTYNGQSSAGVSNLKTLDLTAPTDSDNYGSFTWTHNAQNDTVDFLSGVNATDWHLDSKIIIQETSRIRVNLGADVTTWIAIYMHIVNEYPSDPDRTFTVLLGIYNFESNGFIDLPTGVVNGNSSYNPSIQDQDKFFVTSTANNQRPRNIKISLHAGCPNTQENGYVNLKVTDFKFKISN